jgi:acyl dehydratase
MHDGDADMLDNITTGTIVIEDLEIGMKRSLQKIVTDRDIELFAEVSTDRNPCISTTIMPATRSSRGASPMAC